MATEALEQAVGVAKGVLAGVKPNQLDDPTPCKSWKVRDVINHVVGGSYFFADATNTGESVDDGSETPDFAAGDYLAAYEEGSKQAIAAFGAPGALEKIVKLPFGEFPGAAFMGLATTDTVTHAWDLAKATGRTPTWPRSWPSSCSPERGQRSPTPCAATSRCRSRRSSPALRARRPPTASPHSSAARSSTGTPLRRPPERDSQCRSWTMINRFSTDSLRCSGGRSGSRDVSGSRSLVVVVAVAVRRARRVPSRRRRSRTFDRQCRVACVAVGSDDA